MLRDIITEPSERPDTSMTQNVLTHRLNCLLFAKGLPPSDMGGNGAASVPQIIAHVLPNAAVFTEHVQQLVSPRQEADFVQSVLASDFGI